MTDIEIKSGGNKLAFFKLENVKNTFVPYIFTYGGKSFKTTVTGAQESPEINKLIYPEVTTGQPVFEV